MSITVHKQIASIMEVLTTAAVAEICKLVDEDYTVLHLEMSQFVKENEALKKKLKMLERRVLKESLERGESQGSSVTSRPFGAKVRGESRATTEESCFEAAGKQMAGGLGRGGDPAGANEENAMQVSANTNAKCADTEEGRTESLLIKEERLEEDSEAHGEMKFREEEGK
ncbi:hypothetical protein MATL_G00221150 [Megalops atlanticus]|uniref:Uncharacterized protein n=1 Tax=Megalops atlanticus TaxID=7932 RepID=A0A9D3T2K5_MEGAT|nr:hypothetical protein MATL_G00221150 [Megalops atlanticus]